MSERAPKPESNKPRNVMKKIVDVIGLDSASIQAATAEKAKARAEYDRLRTIEIKRTDLMSEYMLPASLFPDKSHLTSNHPKSPYQRRFMEAFGRLWTDPKFVYFAHQPAATLPDGTMSQESVAIGHPHDRPAVADDAMREYWATRFPGTVANPSDVIFIEIPAESDEPPADS
jgi:hypothetical protein